MKIVLGIKGYTLTIIQILYYNMIYAVILGFVCGIYPAKDVIIYHVGAFSKYWGEIKEQNLGKLLVRRGNL